MAETASNIVTIFEPTYKLDPTEDEKFMPADVKRICTEVIEEKMAEVEEFYSDECEHTSWDIADTIKAKVRELNIPRYKLVVQVTIGESKGQGVRVTSQCLWDVNTDNYASCEWKNEKVWCSAVVFGAYTE